MRVASATARQLVGGWRQRPGRTWLGRAPQGSTARPLAVINCGRVTAGSVAGPHATRTFSAAATAPPLEGVDLSIRSMRPSATLAINEASAKLVAAGETVYKFGLGQSPFPVPLPMVDALRSHAAEKDYIAVAGLPLLREAVAGWCNRVVGGREHTADDIVIGPGSKELLFLTQLVYSGELLLPQGSWVSYQPQAHILRRPVTWLPCSMQESWRLSPQVLDDACAGDPTKPRILVLNSPSNPTGAVYTDAELRALAAVCRKHRILVISDEIYGRLTFDGSYSSIAKHYPEGTVVMSGASKWLGSGGWRVGFASLPRELSRVRDGLLTAASETFTSVAAPLQYGVVPGFLPNPAIDEYVAASTRVLRYLAPSVTATLREAGVRVCDAEGGFYIMPDFSDCPRAARYAAKAGAGGAAGGAAALVLDALTNAHVAMLPGFNFGLPPEALVTRMAFVDFDGGAAIDAVAAVPEDTPADDPAVGAFLEAHCGKVLDGARALRDLMLQA